jgi:gamma-glutamyltranspeptidase / glutathione hydrolase
VLFKSEIVISGRADRCLQGAARLVAYIVVLASVFLWSATSRASPSSAIKAPRAMVVSAQHLATDAGLAILKAGGNAVDAAVAVGYAEAVVNPCCGNIGGGGFMLLHLGGRDIFINFREAAPAAASAAMYLDDGGNLVPNASMFGYKAVGVPGTVLGLERARKAYGRLSRAQVMAPAIHLARDGFVLTKGDTDILGAQTAQFQKSPELAKIFLHADGSALQSGDRLVQKDLADTLEHIAKAGPDYFYRGPVASAVAIAAANQGGILKAADFADYRATQLAPVRCTYRGYVFVSAPPPSSGGVTLCEILNILEGYDLKALGFHSAAATRLMVEAIRYAYADRNDSLGDPAFVRNPVSHLLSKRYAADIRARIDRGYTAPLEHQASAEKLETTHYSIVDKDGNAASVTYTLNGSFGALATAPGFGVLLNDEMDDFTVKPGTANQFGLVQGSKNAIAPGKRPLSSMAPTIVMKDGKPFLVLGSPGGSRIITATLEAALNVIDYGMTPQAAVDAPRIHYQGVPDRIFLEPGALEPEAKKALQAQGYALEEQAPWGAVELIRLAKDRTAIGANDSRRPAGSAAGY